MTWTIRYHSDVKEDMKSIGSSSARRIMRVIDAKLTKAPMQFGAPLSGTLSAFRKLRIGDYRVVYQLQDQQVIVFVLTVGHRRDKEVYQSALRRIS
ncbi:MAG: type II toxin-antitoxin system RelE/ParE family toxin [Desulfatirhabdiaceae bacterium]|jgi:mRNA interferase RelE/StbE|nr:type II toxin-antitoxin system RelE/ParE family toxin [Desulfatirhabdiaceae bacterium]